MMREIAAVTAIALALSAASSFAADLPSRKGPPYIPPPPHSAMWTGFYVGLNAGGAWADSNTVNTVGAPVYFFSNTQGPVGVGNGLATSATNSLAGGANGGFIGGGQVGYAYQINNSFMVGIETDIQGIAGSSHATTGGSVHSLAPWNLVLENYSAVASARRNVDYIGTVRGRLGWLATPTLLIYGTGGFAYGGVSMSTAYAGQESLGAAVFPTVFGATNFSDTRPGWAAGGGAEWMFLPNWSAKVEYLHYDLGTVATNGTLAQVCFGCGFAPPVTIWTAVATRTTSRFGGNIVRAGLNYHFDFAGAPVVAR